MNIAGKVLNYEVAKQIQLFKSLMWRNVVETTYKHKPLYPVAKEEDEVKGVLPLFLMRSLVFGKKRVSVPFAPYGGVCADNETVENVIVEEAKRITKERGVDYLKFRYLHSQEHKSGLVTNNHYVTFILNLNSDPDIVWKKFNNKVRNAIKKALNSNLEISYDNNINEFYRLYTKSMRDLGTPPHSYAFFKHLLLYYLHTAKKMPDTSQSNPKRQRFAKVWSKLPLGLTTTVGPLIRKGI